MEAKPIPTEVKNLFSKLMKADSHIDILKLMIKNKYLLSPSYGTEKIKQVHPNFEYFLKDHIYCKLVSDECHTWDDEMNLNATKLEIKKYKDDLYYLKYGYL